MTQEQFEEEIRNLLESSNRIQAISRYREETGVGLAEAKNAVERLAATGSLPERVPVDDSELFEEVARHPGRGEALLAIKLVRERTALGLKESKLVVDRIGVESGLLTQSGSGCLGVILLGISIPATTVWTNFA